MKTNNISITDEKQTEGILLKPLVVHATDCHKLMTNPQKKGEELSETTKTWLKEKAVEEVLGLRKTVTTKPILKGILCEQNSIELYNTVMQSNYKKNETTKERNGFCGTPDLIGKEGIIEIKTSWDATTFPFFKDEVNKQVKKYGHDWQCRAYMMLFNIERATVAYCLVDTPKVTPGGERLLHEWDNYTLHQFDGIVDAKKRVSMSETIYRDLKIEHKIRERYEVANRYYQDYLKELKS